MILPLRKKLRITLPSTRLLIKINRTAVARGLAVAASIGLLVLSSACSQAKAAGELKWSRPSTPRRVVQEQLPQQTPSRKIASTHRKAAQRDPAIMAAVWAEDDSFVVSQVVLAQAVEDRSVVVRRSTIHNSPPQDRLAQVPEDPFDQPFEENAEELAIEDPPIEEVEEAIEQEMDRRENEQDLASQDLNDVDLFGDAPVEELPVEEDFVEEAQPEFEPEEEFEEQDLFADEAIEDGATLAQVDPFDEPLVEQMPVQRDPVQRDSDAIFDEAEDSIGPEREESQSDREAFDREFNESNDLDSENLSDLFDKETGRNESEDSATVEETEEQQDFDVDAGIEEQTEEELEVDPTGDIHVDKSEEQIEADKNCEEEIAKVRADRIDDIELNITLEGNEGEDFPFECRIGAGRHKPRQWPQITYNWKAAALCHKPLYFEQVHLERYGHSWGPYVQPIMSGVHFFGTLPILPYKMGIRTPTECVYTLGYYRPGSCAPYLIDPVPFTWRAAAFQGGVATGLSFIIP